MKYFIFYFWIFSFILGCNSNKENTSEKNQTVQDLQEPTYTYNINTDSLYVLKETVRNGQSVGQILNKYQVSFSDIDKIAKLSRSIFDLRDVKAGGDYTIIFRDSSLFSPLYFIYEINKVDYFVAELHDSIKVYQDQKELTIKEKTGSGVITSSLWYAMEESNLSAKLVNILADEIYPWTIDFFRLNNGDKFKVVYDAKYVDGEFIGVGKVHAALFQNNGEDYYAIAFNEVGGFEDYFDETGKNLRKFFLKAPVSFTRISSKFTNKRKHPVTGRWKGHFGTDFAAPIGTPIYSTADGIVVEASYTKYNGYYVKIKHNSTYTTQYLHMDKSTKKLWGKKGIKRGKKVRQGIDIIGYVGRTGQATGPHVCYRFWKNGKQVDPFKTALPPSDPVKKEKREEFNQIKSIWVSKLNAISYPDEYIDLDSIGEITMISY
ncbi:MAG: peptidase M23 [Flavobacteriales bacterium]|nr:peptidase M23 [Flavobacteriales bacterium]|tara:strand:- start:15525 stop:16823 length:1299 start_codon:yes stop_codon:yes gene_type:complete